MTVFNTAVDALMACLDGEVLDPERAERNHVAVQRLRAKYGVDRRCTNTVFFAELYDAMLQQWDIPGERMTRAEAEAQVAQWERFGFVARVAEFNRTKWEDPKMDVADGGDAR